MAEKAVLVNGEAYVRVEKDNLMNYPKKVVVDVAVKSDEDAVKAMAKYCGSEEAATFAVTLLKVGFVGGGEGVEEWCGVCGSLEGLGLLLNAIHYVLFVEETGVNQMTNHTIQINHNGPQLVDRVQSEVGSRVAERVVPVPPRLPLSPSHHAYLELLDVPLDLRDVLVGHLAAQEAERHALQREVVLEVPLVSPLLLARVGQREVARRRGHVVDDRLTLTRPARPYVAQLHQHLAQLDLVRALAAAARVLVDQLAEQLRQVVAHLDETLPLGGCRSPHGALPLLPHRRAHHS